MIMVAKVAILSTRTAAAGSSVAIGADDVEEGVELLAFGDGGDVDGCGVGGGRTTVS
jgi:hypothetical protein